MPQRTPENNHIILPPRPLVQDPKLTLLAHTLKKELKELGAKCKEVRGEASTELFGNGRDLPQETATENQRRSGNKCKIELGELGDKCKNMMGEPSTEPFRREQGFGARNRKGKVCSETLTMAKVTQSERCWGKKIDRKNASQTSVKPWRDLARNLPQNLLAAQNASAPEDPRDHETCATLVKSWWNLGETLVEPWWNLPRNLFSAQDGSAPENSRESESNSAPKPLLWLKTPKLLLLGKNHIISMEVSKVPGNRCAAFKTVVTSHYTGWLMTGSL